MDALEQNWQILVEYYQLAGLYEKHYIEDKTINFVGFKKVHPHDTFSLLKLVFVMEVDNNYIRQIIRTALVESVEVFDKIKTLFK